MKPEQVEDLAEAILSRMGECLLEARYQHAGAESIVWKVQSDKGVYALRLPAHNRQAANNRIDANIRQRLSELGGLVAKPIALSDPKEPSHWYLDQWIEGHHPNRGLLTSQTCMSLGRTLRLLHDLPVTGFGRPTDWGEQAIEGGVSDPLKAVEMRFDHPLPVLDHDWQNHPASNLDEKLITLLRPILEQVFEQVAQGRAVLCHADLHEEQFICRDGHFEALIDLGEMTILDPAWDLGSFCYFHGIPALESLLESYSSTEDQRVDFRMAVYFSCAIALHHMFRSQLPGKEHRLAFAKRHLETALTVGG